MIETR
jgi:hypothetical protein